MLSGFIPVSNQIDNRVMAPSPAPCKLEIDAAVLIVDDDRWIHLQWWTSR